MRCISRPTDSTAQFYFHVLRKKNPLVLSFILNSLFQFLALIIQACGKWSWICCAFFYLDILDDVFVCAKFFAKIKNKCFMTCVPQHWFSLCSCTGNLGCVKIILSFERKYFFRYMYESKDRGAGGGVCVMYIYKAREYKSILH